MWRTIFVFLLVSTCILNGCNKDPDSTASSTPPPDPVLPDAVKPRPTTQELTERTKLDLKYDPISLMVPPSWELKSLNEGTVVVLEGCTPTDTVGISIPGSHSISAAQEKDLESLAKKDQALHPELMKSDVVRNIPGALIIEELSLDAPVPSTQNVVGTSPQPELVQTMQWVFTVCVPLGKGFTAYELRFTGLTQKVFAADQDFMRGIINSVALTPPSTDPLMK